MDDNSDSNTIQDGKNLMPMFEKKKNTFLSII